MMGYPLETQKDPRLTLLLKNVRQCPTRQALFNLFFVNVTWIFSRHDVYVTFFEVID